MGRARFAVGDVVYLFMSDERCVRFKLVVAAENCKVAPKVAGLSRYPVTQLQQ
ncbi:MAG: hypothetical protein Q4E41_05975 [Bacteroidales bacterium]|nr:hypothetical protein [Bacteroidales bacterium]